MELSLYTNDSQTTIKTRNLHCHLYYHRPSGNTFFEDSPSPIVQPPCGVHCGTERWAVKTLTDETAGCVNFTAKRTTVSWLTSQPAPQHLPEDRRLPNVECQVWQVSGRLIQFKSEEDGDYHVVLADLEVPDTTIIVEIPDTTCASVCDSAYRSQINQARLDFSRAFGIPSTRFHRLSTPAVVTVTGVGFYDFNHRQTGGARNGVELHPVLDFQLLQVPQ